MHFVHNNQNKNLDKLTNDLTTMAVVINVSIMLIWKVNSILKVTLLQLPSLLLFTSSTDNVTVDVFTVHHSYS